MGIIGLLIDTPGLKARGFHSSDLVSSQSELHFCIRGAPARGDPADRPGTPPPPPLYTRLPNPSTPQLRAVKARVCQDVQVHRRSAGADAGRKRESEWMMMMNQFTPTMYRRGPELQEAGGKGKSQFVPNAAPPPRITRIVALRGKVPILALSAYSNTASHSVLLSVPASLCFHSAWLSVTAHLFLRRDQW